MENPQESNNMMAMFERIQEQRAMSEIVAAVERLVQRNGQFNRKDVLRYLRDYKAEILRCGISKGLKLTSFNQVATDGLQGSIHGIRQQNPTWEAFKEAVRPSSPLRTPPRQRGGDSKIGQKRQTRG